MQRFKIGLNWENNIDQRLEEHQLDLNQGTPDRRGKSPNALRMGSRVLGIKVKVGGEVPSPRYESV